MSSTILIYQEFQNISRKKSESDAWPTLNKVRDSYFSLRASDASVLKEVISRLLTKNQILILSRINGISGITYLLKSISRESNVPLSTLKSSSKSLQDLKLISFKNGFPVEITRTGKLIFEIIKGEKNE